MRSPTRWIRTFALLAAFAALSAQAQWWRGGLGKLPPAGQPATEGPFDILAFQDVGGAARQFVIDGKFDAPDRMHDEFLARGSRSTHGRWLVSQMTMGWQRAFESDPGEEPVTKLMREKIENWRRQRPDSRMAKLAEVEMWHSKAWAARGYGYQSSTTPEGRQLFKERLLKAASLLEAMGEEARQSPLGYEKTLALGASLGQSAKTLDAIHAQAAAKYPAYHPIHETRLNQLLPKWGGSYDAVDAFVAKVVGLSRATEGEAFYAWLYHYVSEDEALRGADLFKATRAKWPRMKKGFEDLVARYPDRYNRNLFAWWACRARDKETTARLLLDLGKDARFGPPGSPFATDQCRQYALGGA